MAESPSPTEISGEEWTARYAATRAALDSATEMAALAALEEQAAAHMRDEPPRARFIAGEAAAQRARRVGLLAGSFNPLTWAHLALAAATQAAAQLELVVWAFAAVTVDKERVERAAMPDRLAQMASYATSATPAAGRPAAALALLNRGLYVDQAHALRATLPAGAELFIIIGFDKLVQIFDPRYYADREAALRELFAVAQLLVAPRAGMGAADLEALLARPENAPYRERVALAPLAAQFDEASSTEARALAAAGWTGDGDLRALLPPEGVALARETGAYAVVRADGRPDPYALRVDWLRALARLAPHELTHAPPLSALVAASAVPGPAGERLRAWLRSAQSGAATTSIAEVFGA